MCVDRLDEHANDAVWLPLPFLYIVPVIHFQNIVIKSLVRDGRMNGQHYAPTSFAWWRHRKKKDTQTVTCHFECLPGHLRCHLESKFSVKVKVWTLAIAPLASVRLVTSSALQSRKWQLSQWCRSTLCGHPLPALTDDWTHGAASRHTIAPISHTRPSPRSRSYYSFPVPLRVGSWVGLSTQ